MSERISSPRLVGRAAELVRLEAVLASLPGVGTINLAQLLAEVGPVLDRVGSAEHAAAECGAAPVTKASGKTSGVYFRWAANRRARKALTAFAHNSRLASPWAGRLYADARARGNATPTPPASSPVPGYGSSGPVGRTPPPTTPPSTKRNNASQPEELTQETEALRGAGGLPLPHCSPSHRPQQPA
jgi:hypothetical protein